MQIKVKRIYDPPSPADGTRILVDRLWPRGVRKEAARLNAWPKDLAPSTELREWFGHDPEKWLEFQKRYFAELDQHPEVSQTILPAKAGGNVTLLFAAKDEHHNNAVAMKAYLEHQGTHPKASHA